MKKFRLREVDRIIEMAWEDRTPFEAIYSQFNMVRCIDFSCPI